MIFSYLTMVPVVCTCIVPCMVYIFEVSLAATCMRIKLGEKLGKRGTCNPDLFIGRQADAKKRHQHIRHTLKGTVPIISPVQQHSIHPAPPHSTHTHYLRLTRAIHAKPALLPTRKVDIHILGLTVTHPAVRCQYTGCSLPSFLKLQSCMY